MARWTTQNEGAGYPRIHTWKPTRTSELRLVGANQADNRFSADQYWVHYYGPSGHYNTRFPESLASAKKTAVAWADQLHPRRKR